MEEAQKLNLERCTGSIQAGRFRRTSGLLIRPGLRHKVQNLRFRGRVGRCDKGPGHWVFIHSLGLRHNVGFRQPSSGNPCTLKWAFGIEWGVFFSSPAVRVDGTIYVGSYDGKLYAIYSSSQGLGDSAWPMFHHDLRHTGNAGRERDEGIFGCGAGRGDGLFAVVWLVVLYAAGMIGRKLPACCVAQRLRSLFHTE